MSRPSHLSRLQRAFARARIQLRYENGVYRVHDDTADASILLPASLPLEEKAVRQLLAFAAVRSPTGERVACAACATPDFHPGSIAPVGSIVATAGDAVIPAAIGTDINCGMRLLSTGLSLASVAPNKSRLVDRLRAVLLKNERDVPVSMAAFKALFDSGPAAFIDTVRPDGLWATVDRDRLMDEATRSVGLAEFRAHSRHAPEAFVQGRETFRDPCLGTPGSGNHFVENGMNIHRKGATPARDGDLALIPGSMGDHSYIARGLGHVDWLSSCSHGAGRRLRRQEMRARAVPLEPQAGWECVTLREERRIEEAPQAYKPIGPVMEAQEEAGLIHAVARLRPWVTFKA